MDINTTATLVVSLATFVIGFWINNLKNELAQYGKRIRELEIKLPEEYISKTEFSQYSEHFDKSLDRVLEAIESLRNDLKHKQDKE